MSQQESDLPIGLSAPARRALVGAGYLRLEQLTKLSEAEVKQLHGIGPNALKHLRSALEAKGLSFADMQLSVGADLSRPSPIYRLFQWADKSAMGAINRPLQPFHQGLI